MEEWDLIRRVKVKWTLPFRQKTKSGFCACAITFQTQPLYPEAVLRFIQRCAMQAFGSGVEVHASCRLLRFGE